MALISVVIPMRNAEPFVAETLRSLAGQHGSDLEIIVVDDGSTDRSAQVVASFGDARVRTVDGPRCGIAAAFNRGLAEARGAYLCRCDADDLYPADRLHRQAAWLDFHPEFGAICGSVSTVDARGGLVAEHFADRPAGEVTGELLDGLGPSHLSAYLFRIETLRQIGGCREWFVTSEDADLQYRFAEAARIWYDPACAYYYRLHEASITHVQNTIEREFFADAARRFLRQRRAGGPDELQRGTPPAVPAGAARATRSTRRQIQEMLLGKAWKQHSAGQRMEALKTGLRACVKSPERPSAWKSLVALAIKPSPR